MKEWGTSFAVRHEKSVSKIVPPEGEASNSETKSTPDRSTKDTKARKGLTYSDSAPGSASVSPLQSFILHQKSMIEDQKRTVYKIEKKTRQLCQRQNTKARCLVHPANLQQVSLERRSQPFKLSISQ